MSRTHNVQLSPQMVEHVMKRRGGRLHAYDSIDPARTALVVIDMQNLWCQERMAAYSPYCAGIASQINRLAAATRQAGGRVYWVRAVYGDDAPKTWSTYMDYLSPEDVAVMLEGLTDGHPGADLWDGMDVRPEDRVVIKRRFSAMIQGSSDLEARLRADGIDTLIMTGIATDVCVESTTRDAYMLNFKTLIVSDATATRSDEAHNASLSALFNHFADVFTTEEVLGLLGAAGAVAAE